MSIFIVTNERFNLIAVQCMCRMSYMFLFYQSCQLNKVKIDGYRRDYPKFEIELLQ